MLALVEFPDTATIARKILLAGLAERGVTGVKVATKLPSPMPYRFIKCFTLPGRQLCRRTQQCQVIAQVYGGPDDDVWCSDTARICGAILLTAPDRVVDGEQPISGPCGQTGPHPYQDPDLPNLPRYQVTVDWTVQSTVTNP